MFEKSLVRGQHVFDTTATVQADHEGRLDGAWWQTKAHRRLAGVEARQWALHGLQSRPQGLQLGLALLVGPAVGRAQLGVGGHQAQQGQQQGE